MLLVRLALGVAAVIVALLIAGAWICYDTTKPLVDRFGNHASVLGLVVSVVGFAFTVWAVLETLRASTKAQQEVAKARQETKDLLLTLRSKLMGETADAALYFAKDARHAVRTGPWIRVAERCLDAKLQTSRLLSFPGLQEQEKTQLRAAVDDIGLLTVFIEKNRLKSGSPSGLPGEKVAPLDLLIEQLAAIRARLEQQLFEVPHVN
jgi:hypothetical protein